MLTHAPSLYLATALALALAGAASLAVALRQRERRGAGCWAAAQGALAIGLGVHALVELLPIVVALAGVAVVQWPLVNLLGVRRFYSRGADGVPGWVDLVVLAFATIATAALALAPWPERAASAGIASVLLAATLYVAFAVTKLEDFTATPTLRMMLAGLLASAAVQALWLGAVGFADASLVGGVEPLAPSWLATAATALLMSQLALVMTHERNVAQMRAAQRRLRRLVEVDPLTQLPNRAHFHKLAERAVKAQPDAACVLVFDVDKLHKINELLGHANGDEALRQIGTAMRETLRRRDVAGRIGGDEFAVVLPRTQLADAEAVVARINARLDDRQIAPRIARVVLNAGGTQMRAGETIADALRRAEITRDSRRDEGRLQLADTLPTGRETASAALPLDGTLPGLITLEIDSMAPTPAIAYAMPLAQSAIPVGDVVLVTP